MTKNYGIYPSIIKAMWLRKVYAWITKHITRKSFRSTTIGIFVIVRPDINISEDKLLYWHEYWHVQQFRRFWWLFFLPVYWWELLLVGYKTNKWEVEAKEFASAKLAREN